VSSYGSKALMEKWRIIVRCGNRPVEFDYAKCSK
jgi:hypothetical protein